MNYNLSKAPKLEIKKLRAIEKLINTRIKTKNYPTIGSIKIRESENKDTAKKIDDRKIKMVQMLRDEALKAFEIWDKKVDKIKY